MTTVARYVLIGMAVCTLLSIALESRADYTLQLIVGSGEDTEIIGVDTYKHVNQCHMVRNQYRLGKAVYGQALGRPIQDAECLPCKEFPALCEEGI